MPESNVESEVRSGRNLQSLEASLERLWEKARRVSDIVLSLKNDNRELRDRVGELEDLGRKLDKEIQEREKELERSREDLLRLQSNGSSIFSNDEKEALVTKIKDLLAKINSRL